MELLSKEILDQIRAAKAAREAKEAKAAQVAETVEEVENFDPFRCDWTGGDDEIEGKRGFYVSR